MNSIRHICQGGTAAELVRTVVGENVVEILDDCASGPLTDVDSPSPDARVAFWADLFALDQEMRSMNWRAELCAVNETLADLGREITEVVIWAGSHPTEQAMRRRIHWWLKDSPVLITEVLVGTEDVANPDRCTYTPIALISTERLRACFGSRSLSTTEDRRKLAAEWAVLRENGLGVRTWEENRLLERPIEHHDVAILSCVGEQPIKVARAVGKALAKTGQADVFCHWRLAAFLQAGYLSIVSGDLGDWRSATVRRCVTTNTQ